MKCKYCGQSVDKIVQNEIQSFETFMNRTIKKANMKLKKESGYGIPDIKGKQWQKRK